VSGTIFILRGAVLAFKKETGSKIRSIFLPLTRITYFYHEGAKDHEASNKEYRISNLEI